MDELDKDVSKHSRVSDIIEAISLVSDYDKKALKVFLDKIRS